MLALGLAAAFVWQRSRRAASLRSVAVVPFTARGSTDADDALGLGMAEAVARRLTALRRLGVPSTTRVMRLVERTRDPREAGRDLGVDAILTGAFARDGGRLTIDAQLARVQDGAVLWQGRHDATFAAVFRVQDEIAARVAESLLVDVGAADRDRLSRHATDDTEAYELYLKGRKAWRNRTPKSIRAAIELFESAIAKDPKFALAHAGLADAYSLTASGLSPRERFPKAHQASLRALELDEGLAEAHTSLAFVSYKFAWDFAASEKSFRRALELQPGSAQAHHWYGEFLSVNGRHDEAQASLARALELEPESVAVRIDQCWSLNRARRYEEAIARCRLVQALEPNEWRAERGLATAARGLKRERDAVEHFLRAELLLGTPQSRVDVMRATCEAEGLAGYWRERVKLLLEQRRDAQTMPYSSAAGLALSYAALQDKEQALKWLSASFEVRDDGPLMLGEPAFDPLRADPRFQELVRRVGGLGEKPW